MTTTETALVTLGLGTVRGAWRDAGTPLASASFLGIPFAQPPVGALRFAAPVPTEPWEGVRDALEYGATPQRGDTGITLVPEPSVPGESTLNVNVFTPSPGDTAAQLPVIVYIHGGGYTSGSPASPWYDGRSFARHGVVMVTVSYRLGFDGFGHIEGAPSNRGVRDWIAALEWVRDHIAAFGGDPTRVTLAGQSAGGGAVLTLLGLPAAQHLFHGAWVMSGALADVSAERAVAISTRLAALAGVPATREGFASVPEERLLALQQKAGASSGNPLAGVRTLLAEGLPWGPSIDGDLITQRTLDSIQAGIGSDKPLVIGATDDEFTMTLDDARGKLRFVPVGLALSQLGMPRSTRRAYLAANTSQRHKGTGAVLGRYVTDAVFRSQVVRVAEARGATPTWTYEFSWPSPTRTWALHCLDLPFWFDSLEADGVSAIAGDDPPQALADEIHGAALSLARTGKLGWTPWSRQPGSTRVFGAPGSAPEVAEEGFASTRALI